MLEPSSFTAEFEVMVGAPQKPRFEGDFFEIKPNASPIPTSNLKSINKLYNFDFVFNPPLSSGTHDLKLTKDNFFFQENNFATTIADGNFHIEIDSLNGKYVGTVDAIVFDRFGREIKIVNGQFEINVVPQ